MTDHDISVDLSAQVRDAAERHQALRLVGHGSKAFYGHAVVGEALVGVFFAMLAVFGGSGAG